jgi:hypothetical protein
MFFRVKRTKGYEYLQIVHNSWESGQSRQRVLTTLGNLRDLTADGQIDALLASGARFSEKIALINSDFEKSAGVSIVSVGADLVFARLWEELRIGEAIRLALAGRRFRFDIERAVYFTVLHRLLKAGSDRSAILKWRDGQRVRGAGEFDLHHMYRAMGALGDELPPGDRQAGATPFGPRRTKDEVEEALFDFRRDLFSAVDIVFFDTTSIYFEGAGGESLGRRGKSKDSRPDLPQIVVGVVMDGQGIPICCETWPGNTTDVKTLSPVIRRMESRFHVRSVCVVSDRGMISADALRFLDEEGSGRRYILGVRMRKMKDVRLDVLSRAGRYSEVSDGLDGKSPLKVKEVWHNDRRYVVCVNEWQAAKDREDRGTIVAALREALTSGGAKKLVGNKGYRKYLKTKGRHVFEINEAKIEAEARYDGKWVLTTNTDLPADEVAIQYKRLWMVEYAFRDTKSLLETRPVYHHADETIVGHVFCSFLALVLKKALMDKIAAKDLKLEWEDVKTSLDCVKLVQGEFSGKKVTMRSEMKGCAVDVFRAVGVAIPPAVKFG